MRYYKGNYGIEVKEDMMPGQCGAQLFWEFDFSLPADKEEHRKLVREFFREADNYIRDVSFQEAGDYKLLEK